MSVMEGQPPDIRIGGLSIWTPSREFPEMQDFWDSNWLRIIARVEASGALVRVSGPLIRIDELEAFHRQLAILYRDLKGFAQLSCLEPGLGVKVTCTSTGHVNVTVEATPDNLTQHHEFEFSIDQSYLQETLTGLESVLERYPMRGRG